MGVEFGEMRLIEGDVDALALVGGQCLDGGIVFPGADLLGQIPHPELLAVSMRQQIAQNGASARVLQEVVEIALRNCLGRRGRILHTGYTKPGNINSRHFPATHLFD